MKCKRIPDSVKRLLKYLRPGDVVVIVFALAILAGSVGTLWSRAPGETVLCSTDEEERSFSLSENKTVELTGPLGITMLEIHDGEARVISSPCQNKNCVRMGPVQRAGETIACIPNHILVRILGKESNETPDAVTR